MPKQNPRPCTCSSPTRGRIIGAFTENGVTLPIYECRTCGGQFSDA